jgi:hypothetical protein
MVDCMNGECILGRYGGMRESGGSSNVAVQQVEKSFDCTQLADGVYGVDCAREFVHCSNSHRSVFPCPPGQVFNATVGTCMRRDRMSCSSGTGSFNVSMTCE